jgi:ubiquinone/menaquinone biosynthesis C-methylase UbiE
MNKTYSENYWSVGFQSNLYDLLSPESYLESMRQVVVNLPEEKSLSLLDAGCGSGLLLRFLDKQIREGMDYTGVDILKPGVDQVLRRAQAMGIANRVSCLQSDLISPFPFDEKKFDVVVGHFSLYTLESNEKRQLVLENLKSVLKPKGLLIIVNPSKNYDADSIIEQSVKLDRERHGFLKSLIKQFMVYPLTKAIGLRYIQKQLRSKRWKAYSQEDFCQEMERGGFEVKHTEEVYAGSAFLGIGKMKHVP